MNGIHKISFRQLCSRCDLDPLITSHSRFTLFLKLNELVSCLSSYPPGTCFVCLCLLHYETFTAIQNCIVKGNTVSKWQGTTCLVRGWSCNWNLQQRQNHCTVKTKHRASSLSLKISNKMARIRRQADSCVTNIPRRLASLAGGD